jgi:hypothetical protein
MVPSFHKCSLNVRNFWKLTKGNNGNGNAFPPREDSKNARAGYDPQAEN